MNLPKKKNKAINFSKTFNLSDIVYTPIKKLLHQLEIHYKL